MHKQWIWNSFCFAFGHRKVKMHNLWEYSSTRKSLLSKEIYLLISACEEQSSVSNKKAARELSGKCFPTHKLSSNSNYTQYKELAVVKTTPYVTAVGCSLAQLTHAGLQIWVEFTLQWKLASYTMFLRKLSPFLTFLLFPHELSVVKQYVVCIDGNEPFTKWQLERGMDGTISSVAGESYRVDVSRTSWCFCCTSLFYSESLYVTFPFISDWPDWRNGELGSKKPHIWRPHEGQARVERRLLHPQILFWCSVWLSTLAWLQQKNI